ncbi:MAG: helix-turn-helix domain-containing protein [Bacteroidales bacterium]|nr:helix-turn-helix domain-containing protein [Bacteroidales bacterium]
MENPFEIILDKLSRIEMILVESQRNRTEALKSDNRAKQMTVEEAAEFLRVSKGSIYRYVMTGVLPKRKFGNKLYFKREALENLIEKSN